MPPPASLSDDDVPAGNREAVACSDQCTARTNNPPFSSTSRAGERSGKSRRRRRRLREPRSIGAPKRPKPRKVKKRHRLSLVLPD
eukprot:6749000-Pyramimonas_sp.AAC.1